MYFGLGYSSYPSYYRNHSHAYTTYYSSYPSYTTYSYPRYAYYDNAYPRYTYVQQPVTSQSVIVREPDQDVAVRARIEVRLPDPEGEVWFEGHKTQSMGTTRNFDTPPLEPGKTYTYHLTAAWHHNGNLVTDKRVVEFTAGTTVIVDFTPQVEVVPLPVSRE